MGGGDLNLKKSWHPHTMKNQEKVWKAEQAKSQEEKKLNDLRREIEEEKNREELKRIGRESGILKSGNESDKKLDWMYKNSSELINREEYLLGRKIDKSFEILQEEEKEKEQQNLVGVKQPLNHVEHECVPFSIRTYKNVQNTEQVDLQRKVMEDPLMLIKQREIESRRKILENPVKLKELHRILKADKKLQKVSKKSKKSKKNKKSKKKHKKRNKSSSSSSSDSDSDLDSKLAEKLKGGFLNNNETSTLGLNFSKLFDSKFEKISQELDKAAGQSKKHAKRNKFKKSDDVNTDYSSDGEEKYMERPSRSSSYHYKIGNRDRNPRSVSRDKKLNKAEERRFMSSGARNYTNRGNYYGLKSSSRTRESPNRPRTDSRERKLRNEKESNLSTKDCQKSKKPIRNSRSKSHDRKHSYRSRSNSPMKTLAQHRGITTHSTTQRSSNLTDEEKKTKLKEMMSNAAWREEERTEVVRKHREAYAKEEKHLTARGFDKDFLNKEVKKAMANQTSVGSRLRANLNNIQRTSAAMDSNFARK